ncbi:NmrA/HSCARG family protein [Streptomyces canus]|uniref:NmrA/HSCARG family protein n=1 Tax=Streptomyces canus TaxID=58343 RepID=UPI0003792ED2|nr:NmrA/HSCARG family protein [Streptomyces canus]
MSTNSAPVLVTGATGKQGGATARALIAAGFPVRALVRDPASAPSLAVEALGAELVKGDLLDRDSVTRATEGVRAVFSVQIAPGSAEGFDFDLEAAQAVNLIEGARAAGVSHFVQSTVSGAGQHTAEFPGWDEGRWAHMEPYYSTKSRIQDRVREAGFPYWTLLKPGFFMDNFLPSMGFYLPRGVEGGLVSVVKPETSMPLVAVRDIGSAAAAAIAAPEKFNTVELELASDYLSMTQIAEILSRVLDVPLSAPEMTMEEAFAAGMPPMGAAHELYNVVGQPARPEFARDLGIPLTSFEDWAREHVELAS